MNLGFLYQLSSGYRVQLLSCPWLVAGTDSPLVRCSLITQRQPARLQFPHPSLQPSGKDFRVHLGPGGTPISLCATVLLPQHLIGDFRAWMYSWEQTPKGKMRVWAAGGLGLGWDNNPFRAGSGEVRESSSGAWVCLCLSCFIDCNPGLVLG